MKINVDIDVTPEEARKFFGLPDLEPMQQRVMEEMERRMLENMDRFSPDHILSQWMSMGANVPQGLLNLVGRATGLDSAAKKAAPKKSTSRPGDSD